MSPVKAHYGGKGANVMKSMRKTYGAKKGKEVFYATENKSKKKKKGKKPTTHSYRGMK